MVVLSYMRIGIFTDFSLPHIGGVETSIFHQHRALRAAGHEVFIISPPMKGPAPQDDMLEDVTRIKSPLPIRFDGADIYHYNRRATQIVDELQLDVVHVEQEFNMGCFGVKYARKRGLPVMYTAHTFYPPQIELFIKQPKSVAIIADLAQRAALGSLRPKQDFKADDGYQGIACHTFAQRKILNVWMKFAAATDVILAPSRRIQDYVGHYVTDKPIHWVPNPFASVITDTDPAAEPVHQPIKIMTSSMLRPEKRIDVLVEAVSKLSEAERSQIALDVFGGGALYDPIQKLIADNNMQSSVRMHGAVGNDEIQKSLMDSDIMVSMSLGFDNQPMTILEAIHAGTMVMYVDKYLTEGTAGENALLSEPSVDGLVDALRKVISDPTSVTQMKKNSKILAAQYTYQTFVTRYEGALQEALKVKS
jgi:1,2-diacylglycerol 3-alpha-glucosyltransferase